MIKEGVCLIAHPDDEVIFGWPVLKQASRIICCSSDLNNPERQWCKDRKKALLEIGAMVGAEVVCLDYNSEFFRLNARNGELNRMVNEVLNAVDKADLLFTHNPWGEYGHLDHILVHQIARTSGVPLRFTGICLYAGWMPVVPWAPSVAKEVVENDIEFYERCKAIYLKYNSWTWSQPPIMRTKIYADN